MLILRKISVRNVKQITDIAKVCRSKGILKKMVHMCQGFGEVRPGKLVH